jgi:hypothetical protein
MASGVYIHHRYGTYGGTARVGASGSGLTTKVMTDKCRYNETRFRGEQHALYLEGGEQLPDYRAAYACTERAASQIAAEHTGGRSAGKSYIYDTTLNAGDGRISQEEMHGVVSAYRAELEARGYRVGGLQYAIHNNGSHTHAHLMYAVQRTVQRADDRELKITMRAHTEQAKEHDQHRTPPMELTYREPQHHVQDQGTQGRD